MKRFSEQFYTKSTTVKLQALEQRELRARVVSYMEYHPLAATQKAQEKKIFNLKESELVQLPISMFTRWAAVVSVLLLVIIPVLAEETVPGDRLYAVKVRFNEEVRSTLTFSPYQKVEWETERLNRRIAEARLLASEGRLTDEVEVEMAAAVKEHTEIVVHEIEALRADDADQATLATIELSTTLQMQSEALSEDGENILATALTDVTSENPAQLVLDVINESLSAQTSQVESSEIPAYEKIMARVELNTTRAYELRNSLGLNPEENQYKAITRRLEDVNRTIEAAQAVRGQDEGLASTYLVDALERTQKIVVFMSDPEAVTVADIEAVVPMVLTSEEERNLLTSLEQDTNRKVETLTVVKAQFSSAASEKVAYTLETVARNKMKIASSSEAGSVLGLAKENVAMLDDMLTLAKTEEVNFSTSTPAPEPTPAATSTEPVIEAETQQ